MEILKNRAPHVSLLSVSGATTNTLDFGGQVGYCMIQNTSSGHITCKPNGISSGFTIEGNTTYVFSVGDLYLTSLVFDNTASGATTVNLEILYSL